MKDIILVSHGRLASGVLSSVELITGDQDHIHAIDMYLDDKKLDEKFNELVSSKEIDLNQTIVITDILGGSVNQEILTKVDLNQTLIITGMNLPLLLSIVTTDWNSLNKESIQAIINQANEQIIIVNNLLDDSDDDFL